MNEAVMRETMCTVGRYLFEKNMVAATDGNLSVRLGNDRYLCTPSGRSKGMMQPEDLVIVDGKGNKIAGENEMTSEFFTHLAAFEERPDINAVIHAHPPKALALNLVGIEMTAPIIPEVVVNLTAIPTTPYACPACMEGSEVIRSLIRDFDAIMIQHHGSVTVGSDLMEAYLRLEKLEHSAGILVDAYQLGGPKKLNAKQVAQLLKKTVAEGEISPSYPFPDTGGDLESL